MATISAQHFGHAVRAFENKTNYICKDAFKQENPDLTVFENLGAGALGKCSCSRWMLNMVLSCQDKLCLVSKKKQLE